MKTIFDHIERVKGQPHRVRRQIAFTSAAIGASLIAVVWFVGSISTGAFAIHGDSLAASSSQESAVTTGGDVSNQGLAGAGAAAMLPQSANVPAHIEIIDATVPASGQKQAEQTTIPF